MREHWMRSRDIGEIPSIERWDMRMDCRMNLRAFLEGYFPHKFRLGWSPHHLRLIDMLQRAILEGLQQAIGFPRGSGKTTISQCSVLWATLYGHRRFVMLMGAEDTKAKQHMEAVQSEILTNDHLFADFPEVIFPFRTTEGNSIRASRQLYRGEPTLIKIASDRLKFPQIDPTKKANNAGAVIHVGTVCGSASRGPVVDGKRPDLVLIDDPQTRLSAKSRLMTRERHNSIAGDIMGMAGPDVNLSALLTCTVIYRSDLADTLLDRKKHPEWHGIRIKMVDSFPSNTALWDKWADLVRECQENELDLKQAHEFYESNRNAMDDGATVYWEHRIQPGFVSAIESAMYLYYRDPHTFASEYQNDPEEQSDVDDELPTPEEIRQRLHRCRPGIVPSPVQHLTAFVDVQEKMLYFAVIGWENNYTGYVIDYGTWPEQRRNYFQKTDKGLLTVGHQLRGAGWDACLRNALEQLVIGKLCGTFTREDGIEMRITRGLIDANWGQSTDIVYGFLKDKKLAPVWYPSHGRYVRATNPALNDKKKRPGEKRGLHWNMTRSETHNLERVLYDTNFWKSMHAQRWKTLPGDPGAIYLPDRRKHELVADHLRSEYGVTVEAKGRKVTEWLQRPERPDNDWLDCFVGCTLAASMLGVQTKAIQTIVPKTRERRRITAESAAEAYG